MGVESRFWPHNDGVCAGHSPPPPPSHPYPFLPFWEDCHCPLLYFGMADVLQLSSLRLLYWAQTTKASINITPCPFNIPLRINPSQPRYHPKPYPHPLTINHIQSILLTFSTIAPFPPLKPPTSSLPDRPKSLSVFDLVDYMVGVNCPSLLRVGVVNIPKISTPPLLVINTLVILLYFIQYLDIQRGKVWQELGHNRCMVGWCSPMSPSPPSPAQDSKQSSSSWVLSNSTLNDAFATSTNDIPRDYNIHLNQNNNNHPATTATATTTKKEKTANDKSKLTSHGPLSAI